MKKYIWLISIFTVIIVVILLFPTFIISNTPHVKATFLKTVTDYGIVQANGTVRESNSCDVTIDFPVFINNVYVQEGDKTRAGQILASVDKKETIKSLSEIVSGLSPSLKEKINSSIPKDINESMIPSNIYSTSNGTIKALSMKPSALTPINSPAAVISDLGSLQAVVSIGQRNSGAIKVGQSANLVGSGLTDPIKATVLKVSPTAKEKMVGLVSETVVDVTLDIDEDSGELKSGFEVTAQIQTKEKNMVTVPYEAVNQDNNGNEYVYIYENGKAKRKNVKTGEELSKSVEIVEGIKEEEVVLFPAEKIKENETVKLENQ